MKSLLNDYLLDQISQLSSSFVDPLEDLSDTACLICEPNPIFGVLVSLQNQVFFMHKSNQSDESVLSYQKVANAMLPKGSVLFAEKMKDERYGIIDAHILCNETLNKKDFKARLLSVDTLMAGEMSKEFVENEIKVNPVVVFSKSYCPFCTKTKSLLAKHSAKHKVIELDLVQDGEAIQATLHEMTGQNTVPNIFIGGQFVGGNSDLQKLEKEGVLVEKLKACGAI
ncbi:hypothetical protein ABG067_002246 [Albugo candida]